VASATGGSETILLVEDEDSVRNLTLKMLHQLGYSVLCASSGAEAYEMAKAFRKPIEILMTDVVMPNMSGKQLSEKIRYIHRETAVLFVSGYTENTVVHHGVLDRDVDFLPKPFSREVLARKLREVLLGHARKQVSGR
jgi:two-component system cell cycle sensor histidine kinase/response regulator CckA